jgi:hypothetical protein
VTFVMSSVAAREGQPGVIVTHPNRDKPVVQATRATVVLLLLVSAALVLIVTSAAGACSRARSRSRSGT